MNHYADIILFESGQNLINDEVASFNLGVYLVILLSPSFQTFKTILLLPPDPEVYSI